MVTDIKQLAVDPPLGAATWQRLEVLDLMQPVPLLCGVLGQRPGNRVIGTRGQTRRPGGMGRLIRFQQVKTVGLDRLAVGQGAGLVQRQLGQVPTVLQIDAALDQDALACRRRQTADDSHRGGNHQRAGAGHHQQHQGAVDPVEPGAAHGQRRQYRHHQGEGEDRRGVEARELVDEALGRGTRTLRLFHRMDDARQGGVARRRGDAKLQRTGFVDGAGKNRVTHALFHRQAFSGDRRLVDRRTAADHLAIEADALTGAHAHQRAEADGLDI